MVGAMLFLFRGRTLIVPMTTKRDTPAGNSVAEEAVHIALDFSLDLSLLVMRTKTNPLKFPKLSSHL